MPQGHHLLHRPSITSGHIGVGATGGPVRGGVRKVSVKHSVAGPWIPQEGGEGNELNILRGALLSNRLQGPDIAAAAVWKAYVYCTQYRIIEYIYIENTI